MDENIYVNKCCAIKKHKPIQNNTQNETTYDINLRCKSKKQINSILCGVHKKHKSERIAVTLNINNEWITIPFTNEPELIIQIQKIKDDIEKEKLDKITKEIDNINNITICKVCCESFPNNTNLIRCSKVTSDNKHLVCSDCSNGHINSLMSDGIASYTCMFNKSEKCGGEYINADIAKVINDPVKQEQWNELINISEIFKLASICDDYVICPLCCKWGCIFEIPAGYQGNFYIPCGKCGDMWCNICKRKSHRDNSCYKLQFNDDETLNKRIDIIDHMIQELVTKSLTHCCSTCGCSYIKEEGCNLMICPKCESMTCYLCNMKLYYKNNTKYWHFLGHDLSDPDAQCKLWNNDAGDGKEKQGNTEFNVNAIKSALCNFIDVNTKDISELIIKRLLFMYDKDTEYVQILIQILEIYNK